MSDLQINEEVLKKTLEKTAVCWKRFPHLTDTDFIADFTQCLHWRYEAYPSVADMKAYLDDFELPRPLLFDILIKRFPLIKHTETLLTSSVCAAAAKCRHIALLDIGCGRGEQLVHILHALNEVPGLRSVTVIGMDKLDSSLEFCKSYVASVSHRFRYSLHFHPLQGAVENLTHESITALLPDYYDTLLINASLTLHHVQEESQRLRVFEMLYSLHPGLLTLAEPDTDCFTDLEEQRILNAWELFGSLYSYISTLPVSAIERKGLKQFFRNELYDTLVLPDTQRFEKYSRGYDWIRLAEKAGFVLHKISGLETLPEETGIRAEEKIPGYISFSCQDSGLLAVIGLRLA